MSATLLPHTRGCFVCGEHNPHGLHLRFHRDGASVVTEFVPQPHHAGFRGIVHGGVLATVLDEAMFWAAACATKRFCLAAELNVRFLKKVGLEQRLLCVANFVADRGRLWESRAELRDESGTVYVRATCKQVPISVADMRHAAEDFLCDEHTIPARELFPDLIT
ncbi:MAG: PaaI family thioesterase [Verrucomicrobiia bacterium]